MRSNPHIEKGREALELMKKLSSSLDGWKLAQQKDKAKIFFGNFKGCDAPIVRGDYLLEGDYNIQEALASAFFPGCRKIWDDRLGESDVVEFYDKFNTVNWFSIKVPWPLTDRDFASISVAEFSDEISYAILTSIEDGRIPEKKEFTRADLIVTGWKFEKVEKGVEITYVAQLDLKGNVPAYILKPALQSLGFCARKMADYVQKYSSPPLSFDVTAKLTKETFDHDQRKYTALIEGDGVAKWTVSPRMYPKGFKVELSPTNASVEVLGQQVTVKDIVGPVQVTIVKS